MRVITRSTLAAYWQSHPDVEQALKSWYFEAKHAQWKKPEDIKHRYKNADFLSQNRVVFNMKGNHYRLVVKIHYNTGVVYVRFIGTHAEYDRIDAEQI